MSWNYRVFRHKYPGTVKEVLYELRETYYDKDGKICAWDASEEPSSATGESVEELIEVLELQLRDAKKCRDDILDFDMEPEGDWDY